MSRTVRAGSTYIATGILAAGETLTGLSGNSRSPQGAVIEIAASATNDGTIDLDAGPAAAGVKGATGAQLLIAGTQYAALYNNGLISVSGGAYGTTNAGPVTGSSLVNQGTLVNAGTIGLSAGGTTSAGRTADGTGATLIDSGVLINTGLISVTDNGGIIEHNSAPSGALNVYGYLSNAGTLEIGREGSYPYNYWLGLGGTLDIEAGGNLRNQGQLMIAGSYGLGGSVSDQGVLTNTGNITIEAGSKSRHSVFVGQAGALTVEAGAILASTGGITLEGGVGGAATLRDAGTLTNNGFFTVQGGSVGYEIAGGGALLSVTGVFANDAYLTVQCGGIGFGYGGEISSGGGASLAVGGVLTNAGTLVAQAGFYRSGPGVITDTGSIDNTGLLQLDGSTERYHFGYLFPYPASLNIIGGLSNSGTLSVGGGLSGGFGAEIYDSGVLTNTGAIVISGAEGKYRDGGQYDTGGLLVDSSKLFNFGFITLDAPSDSARSGASLTVTAHGTLTNHGTITDNATLVNDGTLSNYGKIDGAGELRNLGEILAGPDGGITAASLINDGTIEFGPRTSFYIQAPITSDPYKGGVLDLQANAAARLTGAVASSQTVDFVGNNAELVLNEPTMFSGVLEGLGAASTILFAGIDATGATSAGTTLSLSLAGGGSLDLALATALPSGTLLEVSHNGSGGTELFVQAPGA